jgi:hypothetical protein
MKKNSGMVPLLMIFVLAGGMVYWFSNQQKSDQDNVKETDHPAIVGTMTADLKSKRPSSFTTKISNPSTPQFAFDSSKETDP